MGWILASGLRFGRLVVALAIGLTVIGIAQLRSAPVDVYPEFMPPSAEIQTEALGLSAAEVEQLITVPLEQDLLNGVPWLDRIHYRHVSARAVEDQAAADGRARRRQLTLRRRRESMVTMSAWWAAAARGVKGARKPGALGYPSHWRVKRFRAIVKAGCASSERS
jgi:hypothetical protein